MGKGVEVKELLEVKILDELFVDLVPRKRIGLEEDFRRRDEGAQRNLLSIHFACRVFKVLVKSDTLKTLVQR